MDPSLKEENSIIELPNDENTLFDEDDDVGTSTIPDLSLPSEDEEEEVKFNNVWEYAIDLVSICYKGCSGVITIFLCPISEQDLVGLPHLEQVVSGKCN